MKRYFIVYYICSFGVNKVTGSCDMITYGHLETFLNRSKMVLEITRLNAERGVTVSDIVITGFNEINEREYKIWSE